jgi:sulfate/thiosulfate transport system substrate-binding protein
VPRSRVPFERAPGPGAGKSAGPARGAEAPAGPARGAEAPTGRARSRRGWAAAAFALALAVLPLAAGCGSTSSASGDGGGNLSLVAYSTPKEAYAELIPAFQKTRPGQGVSFTQSYGASGDQERAVEGGLPADVVALSLQPDVDKLVDADLVDAGWNGNRYHGFVTDSVVVFLVRKWNPKNIRSWDDLVKPGVDVISPNPFTSGGAKWNISAAYGAQIEQGKSPHQALDYVSRLFENVSVLDKSAREALQTFSSGKGDVLIAYENEAITSQDQGEDVEYVIPKQTILIENPVAVVKDSKDPRAARAFVDFLHTPEAQKIFASRGYRPVQKSLVDEQRFPTPSDLFEIGKLGGWSEVNDELFDPENGKIAEVFRDQGRSTAG